MGASKLTSQPLLTLSDIRTFFLQNEIPVYFIDFSAYDLIGMEEWIGNFRFINSSNSFDGFHPQAFVPKRKMPNQSGGLEGINNALLQDPQVLDLLARSSSNGTIGKAMFLLFDDETERLAKQLGLEICFPQAVLRRFLDDKVTTTRIAENAGVPCVPNVLSRVENYEQLRCIS
ncbi:MAG: biotin carboxylase, partial [Bacteroidota bacterium]